MRTWWVLGYYHYYPSVDNFEASFHTREEAEAYVEAHSTYDDYGMRKSNYDGYDILDVADRL